MFTYLIHGLWRKKWERNSEMKKGQTAWSKVFRAQEIPIQWITVTYLDWTFSLLPINIIVKKMRNEELEGMRQFYGLLFRQDSQAVHMILPFTTQFLLFLSLSSLFTFHLFLLVLYNYCYHIRDELSA